MIHQFTMSHFAIILWVLWPESRDMAVLFVWLDFHIWLNNCYITPIVLIIPPPWCWMRYIYFTLSDCSSPDGIVCSVIFSCDQAALQMVFSVRLSVCPSVRLSVGPSVRLSVCPFVTPFWLCSHHCIIMKFSGVITNDQSKVHAKRQGQRSKVKVTEVTAQLNRFRTVTPVWIHIWWWNDAYSLMLLRRGALLFFKVICQISRSHSSKNRRIWPRLGVSRLLLQFEYYTNGYEMMHKVWSRVGEVPYCF